MQEIFKAILCEKKKFLRCNNASFTEQYRVKESKIGLHVRKLKTNNLSANVYIEWLMGLNIALSAYNWNSRNVLLTSCLSGERRGNVHVDLWRRTRRNSARAKTSLSRQFKQTC